MDAETTAAYLVAELRARLLRVREDHVRAGLPTGFLHEPAPIDLMIAVAYRTRAGRLWARIRFDLTGRWF